ncbi:four-helix bundle copper-binding protein [Flavihumibacter sp. CACIAM 22H1]|uniref:four-helix bundle copper-binding protein n=1 Tax=Flavihumibacter sp. CACIAM 22H1 TaxID=1812911 RepID=UPI0007A813D5|nr:four-helix bundle copper-binding protein [Flavihumibacter sp. CACIAM 22H1]KYP14350.1 MAG: ferredoxin [Flavihumibacter sp. CACIAM 22H1]
MDNLHVKYKACVEACLRAYAATEYCAASCLKESSLEAMRNCIQLNMEAASVSKTTADLLAMQSPFVFTLLSLCAEVCESCAAECEKHSHDHCQETATLCKHCAEECRQLLA